MKEKENAKIERELQAKIEPLTKKDRVLRILGILAVIAIISVVCIVAVNYVLQIKNIKKLGTIVSNTVNAESAAYDITIKSGEESTTLKGKWQSTPKEKKHKAECDIDYGKRAVQLFLSTNENDAYIYIESAVQNDYMHLDISGLRYAFGDKETGFDWKEVLESLSTDNLNLEDYYDTEKLDAAISDLRNELKEPMTISKFIDCKTVGKDFVLDIDMYDLVITVADKLEDAFKTSDSHKNLMDLIKSEKKELRKSNIHIVISENNGLISEVKLSLADKSIVAAASLYDTGKALVDPSFEENPELCEDVAFDVAYVRILRSGLDVDSAYVEATRSLNALAEHFSRTIVKGTMVVVYDEDMNDFQFEYGENDTLEAVEYGDEHYNSWSNGGYVALDTTNLDSGEYKLFIYEPASGKKSTADADDYNNAYLAATQAFNAILSHGFQMTENAVFVVQENNTEFQFIYQNGNIYDVYEQYYYFVYTEDYGLADMSAVEELPENVKLYIPDTSKVSDK